MKLYFGLLSLLVFPAIILAQPLTAMIAAKGDVNCFGRDNGFVTINVYGGNGPYSFELDLNGIYQANNTINSLEPGNHMVRVRDASFSHVDLSFEISEPLKLELGVLSSQDVICYGEKTGEVTLEASGGTGTYQFAVDQNSFTSSPNFKSLAAGTYNFAVKDDNGCLTDSIMFVSSALSINTVLEEKRDVSCMGDSDGRIRLNAYGGWGNYQYSLDSINFQSHPIFSGLAPGNHRVFTQDSAGCMAEIQVDITEPQELSHEAFKSDITCYGLADGRITFDVSGGSPPYSHSINGIDFRFSEEFADLPPALYTVKVKDINGCETTFETLELTQPEKLDVGISATHVTCKGAATGAAQVSVEGGISPYVIIWNDNSSLGGSRLSEVVAGSYYAIVEDQNGCDETAFVTIEEPDSAFEILPILSDPPFCQNSDGRIQLGSKFGTGGIDFTWSHDPSLNSPTATELSSGTYEISASDELECEASLQVVLPEGPRVIAFFQTFPELSSTFTAMQGEISFINSSRGASHYEWDFGDGKGYSTDPNPTYIYPDPGEFVIQLIARDDQGLCSDTLRHKVRIQADEWVELPDAFSPDGDGINDRFVPVGSGVERFEITFYDKWGRRINSVNSMDEGWNGLNERGEPATAGVYAYQMKVVFFSGFILERGGGLILLR